MYVFIEAYLFVSTRCILIRLFSYILSATLWPTICIQPFAVNVHVHPKVLIHCTHSTCQATNAPSHLQYHKFGNGKRRESAALEILLAPCSHDGLHTRISTCMRSRTPATRRTRASSPWPRQSAEGAPGTLPDSGGCQGWPRSNE